MSSERLIGSPHCEGVQQTGLLTIYDRAISPDELQRRMETAHRPYHSALDQLVAWSFNRHGSVLLLDLHSFGMDLGADVILGNRDGKTATPDAMDKVEGALTRSGFRVARNERFSGGYIVQRHAGDPRVSAIQVELNQRCYLNQDDVDSGRPRPRVDVPRWRTCQDAIAKALGLLV